MGGSSLPHYQLKEFKRPYRTPAHDRKCHLPVRIDCLGLSCNQDIAEKFTESDSENQ